MVFTFSLFIFNNKQTKLQSLLQLILEFNNSSIHVDLKKNRSYYRGRSNSYPVENFDSVQVKDLEPGQSVYLIQGIENIVKPQKRKSGFQRALGHLNTTIKAASGKFGRIDFKGFKKIVQNHPILLLPFVSFQQRLRSEVIQLFFPVLIKFTLLFKSIIVVLAKFF